jgi:hypothetical protein
MTERDALGRITAADMAALMHRYPECFDPSGKLKPTDEAFRSVFDDPANADLVRRARASDDQVAGDLWRDAQAATLRPLLRRRGLLDTDAGEGQQP